MPWSRAWRWRDGSAGSRSSPTGQTRGEKDDALFTEWQVYRMFDAKRGAWATFQYLVRERLLAEGTNVAADGSVG